MLIEACFIVFKTCFLINLINDFIFLCGPFCYKICSNEDMLKLKFRIIICNTNNKRIFNILYYQLNKLKLDLFRL